jgi:hypothetical protein
MKFATVRWNGAERLAVALDDIGREFGLLDAGTGSLIDLIASDRTIDVARDVVETVPLSSVELLAPIPDAASQHHVRGQELQRARP